MIKVSFLYIQSFLNLMNIFPIVFGTEWMLKPWQSLPQACQKQFNKTTEQILPLPSIFALLVAVMTLIPSIPCSHLHMCLKKVSSNMASILLLNMDTLHKTRYASFLQVSVSGNCSNCFIDCCVSFKMCSLTQTISSVSGSIISLLNFLSAIFLYKMWCIFFTYTRRIML